jgi:hypothetical protein
MARFVRVAGCAAICAMGVGIVRLDRYAGINGVLGSGRFNLVREAGGLAVLALAVAAPLIVRARWPRIEPEAFWALGAGLIAVALVVIPIQTLVIGSVALVLVATTQRSPITPATWAAGLIAGLPSAAAACLIPLALGNLYQALFIVMIVLLIAGALAGAATARLATGIGSPTELRKARVRQGLLAGAAAGIVTGLVATSIFLALGALLVLGPLLGGPAGAAAAAVIADRRDRSVASGLFVSSSAP